MTKKRVIIIDDNPDLTRAITRALIRAYDVISFNDPMAALGYLIQDDKVDSVILDLSMPRLSGKDIFYAIHDIKPDLAHRIIYISGIEELGNELSDFFRTRKLKLKKPFSNNELIEKLSQATA